MSTLDVTVPAGRLSTPVVGVDRRSVVEVAGNGNSASLITSEGKLVGVIVIDDTAEARLQLADGELMVVLDKAETTDTTVAARAGTWLIDRVETGTVVPWGRTYRIFPTTLGRTTLAATHSLFGWGDIKGMGVPDQRNLKDQYVCHPDSIVARVKPSWNIELNRPDVGYVRTLLARCNPGGNGD